MRVSLFCSIVPYLKGILDHWRKMYFAFFLMVCMQGFHLSMNKWDLVFHQFIPQNNVVNLLLRNAKNYRFHRSENWAQLIWQYLLFQEVIQFSTISSTLNYPRNTRTVDILCNQWIIDESANENFRCCNICLLSTFLINESQNESQNIRGGFCRRS